MKFGLRTPSLRKRVAARTSVSRYVRHNLGFKAPRGMGWITNPKKAAYNRVYNRTTFSIDKLFSGGGKSGGETILIMLMFGIVLLAGYIIYIVVMAVIGLFKQSEILQGEKFKKIPLQLDHANPICPSCSNTMIKRTARRGRNKGNQFWGCSSFPNCRGTRSA